MSKLGIEAPWYTFQKKVKALFEHDKDISVGEVVKTDDAKVNYMFDIEVRSHEKFLALDRLMPKIKEFGNVTLGIVLYDEENGLTDVDHLELYKLIFEGNPIVKDIKDKTDFVGNRQGFVRFRPEVIQFPDDNLADYNGNWSGLAQDIAAEVFDHELAGVHFCTASVNESEEADD